MSDLRFTPRRKRLLDTIDDLLLTPGAIGFQTTDGVPSDLILNDRAVTEATNKDFRALIAHRLFLADDGKLFLTGHGRRQLAAWKRHDGDERVAAVQLLP